MMIVAFLCFIALIAAWFIAPKELELELPEVSPLTTGGELAIPAAS